MFKTMWETICDFASDHPIWTTVLGISILGIPALIIGIWHHNR